MAPHTVRGRGDTIRDLSSPLDLIENMVFPSLASQRKVIAARKDSAVSEVLYTVVVV